MSEEEYVPEHPHLQQATILTTPINDLTKHVLTMFHLNSLPAEEKETIAKYVLEHIPELAAAHEMSRWCHIQHTLEHFGLITDGVNAYCLKILEDHHDIEGEKFFETITKGFN